MYKLSIFILFVMMFTCIGSGVARAQTVAVIVHKTNPIVDLPLMELKKIFKAERQVWTKSEQILLATMNGEEETKFNQTILEFSTEQFRKYWVKKVFQGQVKPIRSFRKVEEMQQFVAENLYAIGFLNAEQLTPNVKAIRIDSKAYNEPGYILK